MHAYIGDVARTNSNDIVRKLLFVGLILSLALAVASAATHNVSITPFTFTPRVLTVTNGDTVTWTGGMGDHTVSPRSGVMEPFCGDNKINSCTVTFNVVGSFRYQCNEHPTSPYYMTGAVNVVAAPLPPIVSITNPPNNMLFAVPGIVAIGVSASDGDGTVTSVRLLTNGVFAATNTSAPFGFILSNLVAGNYTLRARATDSQALSATSTPVNIRVVTRPPLTATRPMIVCFDNCTNPPLQFSYTTVTGVSYVIEGSIKLTNFSPIVTNLGNGATQSFTQTNPAPAHRFFRVRLE
jgi:plastocyanin